MIKSDKEKIEALLEQAYKVVIRFPYGKTFTERYDVYQFDESVSHPQNSVLRVFLFQY